MIWVFKTSVNTKSKIKRVSGILNRQVKPKGNWNFDLDDCDKILRIECEKLEIAVLRDALAQAGVACEELTD